MSQPSTRAHMIMLIDDDEGIRFAVSDALGDIGYRVLVAKDGEEGLQKLRDAGEKPCVILLDLMMPGMDGWAFRAVQREDPAISHIPVVVLSADIHVLEKASELTVDGFLAKPAKMDDLIDAAERYCRLVHP